MSLSHALKPGVPAPLPPQSDVLYRSRITVGERSWKLTAFLTGLGSQLFIRLIGYLAFTEVFFLMAMPVKFQALMSAAGRTPSATVFAILWILWVFGSITADLVNGTPFDILARGVSRSLFLGLNVLFLLALWLRKPMKIEFFLLGYPVSLFASRFAFKSGAEEYLGSRTTDFSDWKSNTSYLIIGVVYAIIARYYRRAPRLIAFSMLLVGVFFTAMGSRSFAMTQFLAAVLMLVFPGGREATAGDPVTIVRRRRGLLFRIFAAVTLGAAAVSAAGLAYKAAARAGYLGEKEKAKLEDQERAAGGVLVGGRFGTFVGVWAALHKPIIGHGSWPLDTYGYTQQVVDMLEIDTRDARMMTKRLYWIPFHSALVGGWVEHGVFGLLFWLFVLYLVFVNYPRAAIVFPQYAGLYAFIFAEMIWHVIFSPAGHRVIMAAKIVSMLLVDDAWRRETRDIRTAASSAIRSQALSGSTIP